MRKTGILIGITIISFLMVSTATAVPTTNSEIVINSIEETNTLVLGVKNLAGGALLDLLTSFLNFLTSLLSKINNLLEKILGPAATIVNIIESVIAGIEQLLDLIDQIFPPE